MSVDLLRDGLLRVRPPTAEEGVQGGEPASAPTTASAASLDTPCELCGLRPATARCVHCESRVCSDHHWAMLGLCHECLTEGEARRARTTARSRRPDLDIKWVDD